LRRHHSGLEHLVAIAVKAGDKPADFTWLAQPNAEQALRIGLVRGAEYLESPLGRLLQQALFAEGDTRGLERGPSRANHALRLLSWRTLPGKPGAGSK